MKSNKPALPFIFVTMLVDIIGLGIILPVLPALIQELTGGTISDASKYGGWMMFAYAIMQFLFSPILGGLSDRYGRRPILLISLFGFGLDYLFLAFAPTIGWLFVGRLLAGICGASITTATAYIADISTPEKRAQNFGIVGMAFGIGFIVGPVIGGVLGEFGSRIPFFAAAGLTFLNWVYGYFVLPESLSVENRRKFEWKRANPIGSLKHLGRYPVILGLVASLVLVYIAAHAVQSTWTFFTIERFSWSKAMVGYSLGMAGLCVAIVQGGLIRVINPRLGPNRSVYVGMMMYTVGLSLFAFSNQGWMMFVFLIPYCLGGIAGPSLQGIISNQVPANEQGELQGALTSLISVTSIIGPPLMTNLFAFFTRKNGLVYFPGAAFMMGAILVSISGFLAWRTLSGRFIK
ncbi:MAG: TCR/Tet family MFS transporter [Bacteroidia bacterium]|jgi:DHA1 family tetracycline resistance protein-like MFS transporter|nr:TCR/Tet family MFS transporter [Bacteroidota bacterium]MBP6511477.1 TCR/Tet family MFS transporter [Bacteroidia bacterium]MBP7243930.1 TCR/Tet family MFS transporter [Bacteroidia bacterium]